MVGGGRDPQFSEAFSYVRGLSEVYVYIYIQFEIVVACCSEIRARQRKLGRLPTYQSRAWWYDTYTYDMNTSYVPGMSVAGVDDASYDTIRIFVEYHTYSCRIRVQQYQYEPSALGRT